MPSSFESVMFAAVMVKRRNIVVRSPAAVVYAIGLIVTAIVIVVSVISCN